MAKHRANCPQAVVVAAGLTVLLGCAVIVEIALWNVPYSLGWQLLAGGCAALAALGLHAGRRRALLATVVVLAASPVAALVAARELTGAASVPYLLAPAILTCLVPRRVVRRWFRAPGAGRHVVVASHAVRGVRRPVAVALR